MRMKIIAAGEQPADKQRGSVILLGDVHDIRELQRLLGREVDVDVRPVRGGGLRDR